MIVVGNKVDLARTVAADEARAFADSIRAPYIETSAATGDGVDPLFETIARLAWATAALSGASGPG
jgi:50S ribosomal subunit-associated GTPase HflX